MMRRTRAPRHRNHPVPGPRRARIRGLLGASAATAAATLLAIGGAGGTYAYFTAAATTPSAGVVSAGTASLQITAGSTISLTGLYPTAVKYAAVTVQNTGDVPLQLTVDSLTGPPTATAFSSSLSVGVGIAGSAANCTNGATVSSWTGTFASAPAGSLGTTLAAGASATVCVATTMAANAATGAQNASAGYTLTLGGRQP